MTYPMPPVPQTLPDSLSLKKRSIAILDFVLTVFYVLLSTGLSLTLIYGPDRYHNSAATELIAGLGISWTLIGILFAANALLLLHRFTRTLGWLLGAALYGYYFLSVFTSIVIQENSGSGFAVAAAFAAFASQISGLGRSIIASEWRKNREL